MRQILRSAAIVLLFLHSAASKAENSPASKRLEESSTVSEIRSSIIERGIAACEAEHHIKAVQLLEQFFLNPRKVIATSLEIKGFACLAIAYQNVGQSAQAVATILQAISITDEATVELADLEYTAGIIADLQDQKAIAIAHWEKARQLYLAHKAGARWVTTTLNLAENYRDLGNVEKYRYLLQEL